MGVTLSMAAPASLDLDCRSSMRILDVGQLDFGDGEIFAEHDVTLQVFQEGDFRIHHDRFRRTGANLVLNPADVEPAGR